jgi:hypothetical protein
LNARHGGTALALSDRMAPLTATCHANLMERRRLLSSRPSD